MSTDAQQPYYDRYWNRADDSTWTPEIRPWPESEFRSKFGHFVGAGKILDVGCGDATTYHRQLLGIVHELYGLDVSFEAVEAAKDVGMIAQQGKFDSEKFPFADSTFDGAACIEVLEHLFDPLFAAREVFRVLKPGSLLVTSVPNFGYFADRLEALFRARLRTSPFDPENPYAGAHIRFFSLREFKRLLRKAGFEVERVLPHGSCSIFDSLWVIGHLVSLSVTLKKRIPYVLRFGFLEKLLPAVFAQHILVFARKPEN
jgi:SAM-dependent methyltransferase